MPGRHNGAHLNVCLDFPWRISGWEIFRSFAEVFPAATLEWSLHTTESRFPTEFVQHLKQGCSPVLLSNLLYMDTLCGGVPATAHAYTESNIIQ